MGKLLYFCVHENHYKKRLDDFCKKYPDAKTSLKFWSDVISSSSFFSIQEVAQVFNSADFVGNERLVFNISHNKYRLVAKFKCHARAQRVYIRFIGTHSEYDKFKDISNI
ncbi:MAG: type II toxin-antitoxin system HigB family toxin [Saprospiraceae bacterium]